MDDFGNALYPRSEWRQLRAASDPELQAALAQDSSAQSEYESRVSQRASTRIKPDFIQRPIAEPHSQAE
jgi:hypothetical protein